MHRMQFREAYANYSRCHIYKKVKQRRLEEYRYEDHNMFTKSIRDEQKSIESIIYT
jgi:nitrous oxidase accessory protein NosD